MGRKLMRSVLSGRNLCRTWWGLYHIQQTDCCPYRQRVETKRAHCRTEHHIARMFHTKLTFTHHTSGTGTALASGSTSAGFQDFKMATLVYLSLSGMAPAYLATNCQLVSDEGSRQLCSATSRTCVVRRTYSNYRDRCFAAAGTKLRNSLPAELRQADISFQRLKQLLKTFCLAAEIAKHCD